MKTGKRSNAIKEKGLQGRQGKDLIHGKTWEDRSVSGMQEIKSWKRSNVREKGER